MRRKWTTADNLTTELSDTRISFDILTTTDEETMRFIKEQVASNKAKDADLYAGGAEYLLYQGKDLYLALSLANKAMQLDKNSWGGQCQIKAV